MLPRDNGTSSATILALAMAIAFNEDPLDLLDSSISCLFLVTPPINIEIFIQCLRITKIKLCRELPTAFL